MIDLFCIVAVYSMLKNLKLKRTKLNKTDPLKSITMFYKKLYKQKSFDIEILVLLLSIGEKLQLCHGIIYISSSYRMSNTVFLS